MKKHEAFFLAALLFLSVTIFSHADNNIDDLTKRVSEIEKQQVDVLSQVDEGHNVQSFHRDNLTFGGFFEHSITSIGGSNTATQINTLSSTLGINLSAEYDQQYRFVSQIITGLSVPLQNPNAPRREFKSFIFGALVGQAYLEHVTSDRLHIQGGMGYVPFGYYFQIREKTLMIRRGGPQILSTTDLVAPIWTGINIFEEFRKSDTRWGFAAYTFTAFNYPKIPGLGARVWLNPSAENLTFGISNQVGKQDAETYDTLGADFRLKVNGLTLTSAFANKFTPNSYPWSVYLEPSYTNEDSEWIVYVFGDYSNNPKNLSLTGADPIKKWEYGAGVNWLPISYARIRTGLTFNDYIGDTAMINGEDRDYISVDLSVGVSF